MADSGNATTVQWSQLGCFLFHFALLRAFELDQKLTQYVAQIILYYDVQKKFFLLELFYQVLSISEYVLEKHCLLSILMQNLHEVLHK